MNSSKKPKVVLSYNDDTYLLRFKGSLIRELIASDHQVYAVCPLGPSVLKIQELGATFVEWKVARSIVDPAPISTSSSITTFPN